MLSKCLSCTDVLVEEIKCFRLRLSLLFNDIPCVHKVDFHVNPFYHDGIFLGRALEEKNAIYVDVI